eukprot:12423256-Karenia_brevis.AAC.1
MDPQVGTVLELCWAMLGLCWHILATSWQSEGHVIQHDAQDARDSAKIPPLGHLGTNFEGVWVSN